MFARIKKSGKYEYLQVVENRREGPKVNQRVIATLGRLDQMHAKGEVETLVRSLARFSEQALLILSGRSNISAESTKIGPALIFERLWKELGIPKILQGLLSERFFTFDVERALFLTVLHRLMVSGSDRFCDKWRRDYEVKGTGQIELHHLYRAMAFLGEETCDQRSATPFAPRCTKDVVEERLFHLNRHLYSGLDLVFFDTTSIYFEGAGGETIGERGFSKDHRPDLNQMVVGVVLDDNGRPLCCEMWPGNTADVKTLAPVVKRIRDRFHVSKLCVVADRGMISRQTLADFEKPESKVPYILGVRMRNVTEVKREVLSRAANLEEVVPEGTRAKDPSPLKVEEVWVDDRRYIVCLNPKQARKDAADREAILASLEEQLKNGPKALVGNKGYRRYLRFEKGSASIDRKKAEQEARFDGKWVLKTNTRLPAKNVASKYKQLWQVEHTFRNMKSYLKTRPVYHRLDQTIRGHVFCSFLALMLKKELYRRLEDSGHSFEWAEIKQDLKALTETVIEEDEKRLAVRSQCKGVCGKVFQAVGVAIPPTIREI
jgi:transposase